MTIRLLLQPLKPGDMVRLETKKGWQPAKVVTHTTEPRSYVIDTGKGV